MDELKYYKEIEAFVEGNLSETDRDAFTKRLEAEVELRLEHQAYLETKEISLLFGYDILVDSVREDASPPSKKRSKQHRSNRLLIWVVSTAAVMLILLFAGRYHAKKNYNNVVIANQYYAEVNVSSLRSGGSEATFDKIADRYEDQDYRAAIELAKELNVESGKYLQSQLLLGHMYMKTGQYQAAIDPLSEAARLGDFTIGPNARWQLALAHLYQGDLESANRLLQQIANDDESDYHEQAIGLIKEINSPWRKLF